MLEKLNQLFWSLFLVFLLQCFTLWQGSASLGSIHNKQLFAASINKCQCKLNETLFNGICESSQNLVPVWDYENETDYIVDISQFASVIVQPLKCPEGHSKLNLNISQFVIYINGLLQNLALENRNATKLYCIDHIKINDGITLLAEVCDPNPVIPICCSTNFTHSRNGTCAFNNYSFSSSFSGGFLWDNYNLINQNIVCKNGETLHVEPLVGPYEVGAVIGGYPLGNSLQLNSIFLNQPEIKQFKEYCVEETQRDNDTFYYAQFCITLPKLQYEKICNSSTCIRICCPDGFIIDVMTATCIEYSYVLQYQFLNENKNTIAIPENLEVTYGFPLCEDVDSLLINLGPELLQVNFSSDGSLLAPHDTKYLSPFYCVDGFANGSVMTSAAVCLPTRDESCQWRWVAGSVLLAISCVFYIVTLVIYISIEQLRTRMVGKCLISQVSALLITYLTLIFLQNSDDYSEWKCNFPGTVEHIAILASFFWLNVMCYDMWSALRSMRPTEDSSNRTRKRFLCYCIYAWGFPLLIATIRVIIDQLPSNERLNRWQLKAHFGTTHCFFTGTFPIAKWLYLYGPILILLFINLIFFINVAIIIMRSMNETKKLIQGPDSGQTGKNLTATKERVVMYLKLFLVMGISWMLEIIMWVAVSESDCYFWALDVVNMFQGVFIFVIFVCKRSTLEKVRERFWCNRSASNDVYQLTNVK